MGHFFSARIRRTVLCMCIISTVAVASMAGSVQPSVAARLHDASAPVGTDLWHLDTATEHYTQANAGLTRLQLYNSPVGIADADGWHVRDTTLNAPAAGSISPANLPFALHIATTSAAPQLASLTNEDGVQLGVGLAAIGGQTPSDVAVQVNGSTATYPAPVTSLPSDIAVQATVSGIDLRATLHSSHESGQFVFTLIPDARTHTVQDANGVIRITRPITAFGDAGTPSVTIQPEYFLELPTAVDSSTDAVALPHMVPVSLVLMTTSTGQETVTVRIDPAWLQDPKLIFPVRLSVPIVTAYSAVHTGWFNTVTSCATTAGASQTDVIVGTQGSCVYRAAASFDTSSLLFDTPIVSATLHLYTPDQTGPTDVQVLANASPSTGFVWHPVPWIPPTWNDMPAPATAPVGIAQSESDGHWQTWDVSALVSQWVQNPKANGGLTLIGSGAPIHFASAVGMSDYSPAIAPYLEIVYGSRPAINPFYSDGAQSIFGISGAFGTCTTVQCGSAGPISINQVGPLHLSGNYIRVGAVLDCNGGMPTAGPGNSDTIVNILFSSPNSAYRNGVIPIVDFLPNDSCLQNLTPSAWQQQVTYFIDHMMYPRTSEIYFEIGNEPSTTNGPVGGPCGVPASYGEYGCNAQGYADRFAAAAQGIVTDLLDTRTTYRILTAGMLQPTAQSDGCTDIAGHVNPIDAGAALHEAEAAPYSVKTIHLGGAVHPYSYNTNETSNPAYWRSYYHSYGSRGYGGVCEDLGTMIVNWTSEFSTMPVIFTEVNWSAQPTNIAGCPNDSSTLFTAGCAGTYLVDLFTWLYDHNSDAMASSSVIRVEWFRGIDADKILGLYKNNAAEKPFNTGTCPNNSAVAGFKNMSDDYHNMIVHGACY